MPLCFDEGCIFKVCVIVVHRTSTLLHFYFCTLKIKKEIRLPTQLVETKDERSCSTRKKLCFLWVCALSHSTIGFLNSLPVWLSKQLAVGVLTALPFAAHMLASRMAYTRCWLLPACSHGGTGPTRLPCQVKRKA